MGSRNPDFPSRVHPINVSSISAESDSHVCHIIHDRVNVGRRTDKTESGAWLSSSSKLGPSEILIHWRKNSGAPRSLPLICTKEGVVMDLQYDSITKPNKASTHFNKRGFCGPKADPIELL